MTIWRMRNACWISKATDTHSQYVILVAFPLQQWPHERTTALHWLSCQYGIQTVCKRSFLTLQRGGTNSYHWALKCWTTERTNSTDSQTWRYPTIMKWLLQQQHALWQLPSNQLVLPVTVPCYVDVRIHISDGGIVWNVYITATHKRHIYSEAICFKQRRLELHETRCRHFSLTCRDTQSCDREQQIQETGVTSEVTKPATVHSTPHYSTIKHYTALCNTTALLNTTQHYATLQHYNTTALPTTLRLKDEMCEENCKIYAVWP